ncbi:MAG: response regulator [Chloroflexi bacterium]|nr:response regulator [Chloroflexota bacterium]
MVKTDKFILVVDDVEDWQKTLKGLLMDEGYQVIAVGDQGSALNAVKAHKFDLAIVDIRLDEADEDNSAGLDLASELRRKQTGVPVVMITGYEREDTIARALKPDETGQSLAADFVLKTNADELVDIVKRRLGSWGP